MFQQLGIRQKLFISLSFIFTIFTVGVMLFLYEREKEFKIGILENTLDNITDLTSHFIQVNSILENDTYCLIDSLLEILPVPGIRVTVINPEGIVMYESEVEDIGMMENHLDRPEIQGSMTSDFGESIRESATTGRSYYYYARFYKNYYVRTAVIYDIHMKDFLHAEKLFLLYLFLLFLLISVILLIITKRFSDTITRLKDFAIQVNSGKKIRENIKFPKDELGTIGSEITSIYQELSDAKEALAVEKNKLFRHLNALNEGIAFFSSEKRKILQNNHFIRNLNLISEESNISAEKIFEIAQLEPITQFIEEQLQKPEDSNAEELPMIEIIVQVNNRYFKVYSVFFQDNTFEIVISDITRLEKRRMIKQQMTSNISHELKTPVSSILGYLETLQHEGLKSEKKAYFIERALTQAKRLSEIIEDLATLNRIEEGGGKYAFEQVKIRKIVDEVKEHLKQKLDRKDIKVNLEIPKKLKINGVESLLFSVFYNLFDNVIKYGGDHIEIKLSNYLEDKKHVYFSFANTGNEIDEKHLFRIFERFYRIDDGRSRKTGGTGLGLAIVKNAIQLHHGEISARKYKDGGIEFLFSLTK